MKWGWERESEVDRGQGLVFKAGWGSRDWLGGGDTTRDHRKSKLSGITGHGGLEEGHGKGEGGCSGGGVLENCVPG